MLEPFKLVQLRLMGNHALVLHRLLVLLLLAVKDPCRQMLVAQVLETLKDPIQTLVLGREAEVVYAVLSNFLVLAQRYPVMFSQVRATL